MEQQLSLHLKTFNKRIQVMNQTNARELTMSALEARNLHAELFELLAHIADLTEIKKEVAAEAVITAVGDGGSF